MRLKTLTITVEKGNVNQKQVLPQQIRTAKIRNTHQVLVRM